MESIIGKSATKTWRESKTNLGFKEWITQQKEKMSADGYSNSNMLLVDRSLNDSVQNTIQDVMQSGGLQTKTTGKTVFGINKTVFIISALAFTAGAVYLVTRINK